MHSLISLNCYFQNSNQNFLIHDIIVHHTHRIIRARSLSLSLSFLKKHNMFKFENSNERTVASHRVVKVVTSIIQSSIYVFLSIFEVTMQPLPSVSLAHTIHSNWQKSQMEKQISKKAVESDAFVRLKNVHSMSII